MCDIAHGPKYLINLGQVRRYFVVEGSEADGTRIIRHDPGGFTTLTLPDGTELRANGSGAVAGTRYYNGLAVRAANTDSAGNLTGGDALTWTINDHHGTGAIAINPTTLQVDRRRSLPYGGARGPQPNLFGSKGFVGGTTDPTGLTHLGAREHDPTIGRFISIDPVLDLVDPQALNGYAYANNNPTTSSDPSGLLQKEGRGGCYEGEYGACSYTTKNGVTVTTYITIRDQYNNSLQCIYDWCFRPNEANVHKLADEVDKQVTKYGFDTNGNLNEAQVPTVIGAACVWSSGICDEAIAGETTLAHAAAVDWLESPNDNWLMMVFGLSAAEAAMLMQSIRAGGTRNGNIVAGGGPTKPVNLPSWRRVGIDMEHIQSGHTSGGSRTSPNKDLFPNMTPEQIERAIRDAYRHSQRTGGSGTRIRLEGKSAGLRIEMWLNRETGIIETAYPIWR